MYQTTLKNLRCNVLPTASSLVSSHMQRCLSVLVALIDLNLIRLEEHLHDVRIVLRGCRVKRSLVVRGLGRVDVDFRILEQGPCYDLMALPGS